MRAAEFMRTLADLIDKLDGKESNDQVDDTNEPTATTFIPPLQQKLDIMKKIAGETPSSAHVTILAADEDEPFDG